MICISPGVCVYSFERALDPSKSRVAIRANIPALNPPINIDMKNPQPRTMALMLALPNTRIGEEPMLKYPKRPEIEYNVVIVPRATCSPLAIE
jgi:hypothetical protein